MKTIAELREAFADSAKFADKVNAKLGDGLPDCWVEYVGNLADMVLLLADPTPITTDGLRELGFKPYCGECLWRNSGIAVEFIGKAVSWNGKVIKSLGRLRGLLLFAGW